MDANVSYPLVPLPPEQGSLVPVVSTLVAEPNPEVDCEVDLLALLSLLWHCFCQLALLFWLALVTIGQLRRQMIELRLQANYWQALHRRAVQREAVLKAQVQQCKAEIRDLKRRLFGRKSETTAATEKTKKTTEQTNNGNSANNGKPRSRGQQPGSSGHGRRNHDHLPTHQEDCVLADADRCCPDCGALYEEIPGTADGDILEIEVRAYRRRYRRKRYRQCCTCAQQPRLLTAPPVNNR